MNSPDNYAVMGYPIHHSKSPRIHALFAEETEQNMSYLAQEVRPENFTSAVNTFFEKGGKGLNCTLPLLILSEISPTYIPTIKNNPSPLPL